MTTRRMATTSSRRARRSKTGPSRLSRCPIPKILSGKASARRRLPLCRSEEHTSELQSLMRISYAVFCLQKQNKHNRAQLQPIGANYIHPTSINLQQSYQSMHTHYSNKNKNN